MDPTSPSQIYFQLVLDGVHYALGSVGDMHWRLGALNPHWRAMVGSWHHFPDEAARRQLAENQVWIAPAISPPALTVMCCGLGSAWPGMGRDLYEQFPVARRAMDAVAALADWDLLGLMSETDPSKISQTRWQIPYLFVVEYGQWALLRAMGLSPALICGHSLGELIALCLSGILSLEAAWCLLETRAEHMAELEAKGGRQGGMLAVPAPMEVVDATLRQWPQLRISNRNTSKQYILSGPRETLLEARRHLRKQRIPAVMLGMDLAFHNPAMRILRDMSVRRLNGLSMHTTKIPLISCVDASFYPHGAAAISSRIADLDENTVDWCQLLTTIVQGGGGEAFLELGPQETLCAITEEQQPQALCLAVDRKGHESEAMRIACARLFADGYLSPSSMVPLANYSPQSPDLPLPPFNDASPDNTTDLPTEFVTLTRELLGSTLGRSPESIALGQDLRHDLGLRSSAFPFLLLEAERRLSRPLPLENLFQLTTVADVVRFVAGLPSTSPAAPKDATRFEETRMGITRYVLEGEDLRLTPFDITFKGLLELSSDGDRRTHVVFVAPQTPEILAAVNNIESLGCTVTIFQWSEFVNLNHINLPADADGAVLLTEARSLEQSEQTSSKALNVLLEHFHSHRQRRPWLCVLCTMGSAPEGEDFGMPRAWLEAMRSGWLGHGQPFKAIAWLAPPHSTQNTLLWADMLTMELLHGEGRFVLWSSTDSRAPSGFLCPTSKLYSSLTPHSRAAGEMDGSALVGRVQFSPLRNGGAKILRDVTNPAWETEGAAGHPWLRPSSILSVMGEASRALVPWLRMAGFSDLRIGVLPSFPPGVIRECDLRATARLALPQEGVAARFCHISMELESLTPTARRTGASVRMSEGSCLMAAAIPPPAPLWRGALVSAPAESVPPALEADWLAVGFEAPSLVPLRINLGTEVAPGYESALAPTDNPLAMADMALMAAMATMGLRRGVQKEEPASVFRWRLGALGFMRFSGARRAAARLQWRISWQDARLLRFDLQALDVGGEVVVTMHSLEFDAVSRE